MRGQIIVFNAQKQAGVIFTQEKERLLFHVSDWQDVIEPEGGMKVEFTLGESRRPEQIQLAAPDSTPLSAAQAPQATAEPITPLAQRPKQKSVLTLFALLLGVVGAHRFYMGSWGWGLIQLFAIVLIVILSALLPPLGGLLYLALLIFILVELVRYIWLTDKQFESKLKAYQASRPGPFSFFW